MSRIRKFNESRDQNKERSFYDLIQHETYVLQDLKSNEKINYLDYVLSYFDSKNEYQEEYDEDDNIFIKMGIIVKVFIGDATKINLENLEELTKELIHIQDKLKLDYIIPDLNSGVYKDRASRCDLLYIEFKIIQK